MVSYSHGVFENFAERSPQTVTTDLVVNVSNSPTPTVAKLVKSGEPSSSKGKGKNPATPAPAAKTQQPVTLPRPSIRASATPFVSSPSFAASLAGSGSTSTIDSNGAEAGVLDGNGNVRMGSKEPAAKKRRLTHGGAISVQPEPFQNQNENLMQLGQNVLAPVPTPKSAKRARQTKNPDPVAIGTVQLDDHRPNTVLGLRNYGSGFSDMGQNMLHQAASQGSQGPGMNRPWSSNGWNLDHSNPGSFAGNGGGQPGQQVQGDKRPGMMNGQIGQPNHLIMPTGDQNGNFAQSSTSTPDSGMSGNAWPMPSNMIPNGIAPMDGQQQEMLMTGMPYQMDVNSGYTAMPNGFINGQRRALGELRSNGPAVSSKPMTRLQGVRSGEINAGPNGSIVLTDQMFMNGGPGVQQLQPPFNGQPNGHANFISVQPVPQAYPFYGNQQQNQPPMH